MSRVELKSVNPEHEVIVGLDRPLSTFFISVMPVQADDDLRDLPPVVFKDQWKREEVVELIGEYAVADARTNAVVEAIWMDLDPADHVPARLPKDGDGD